MASPTQTTHPTLLAGAHVIDPAQGIDGPADVLLTGGIVTAIGATLSAPAGAKVIDLAGHYLTPGWIDIHVHALGTLGFGDPDAIGIDQGVTSFVDAGGPGIKTLDEFEALSRGRLVTDLYAGPYNLPMGIVGFDYDPSEQDLEDFAAIPLSEWHGWMDDHPGMLRYLKGAAYSPRGERSIAIAKHIANELGLPFYLHIGENHTWPDLPDPFDYSLRGMEAGDIVTHIYNGCPQGRAVDQKGTILPVVQEAAARGVLFDIGFGSYGFAWDVAEAMLAQGLRPTFISSDLQQFNVASPTYSLAHVMTICLRLGLPLAEVIACVTANPARHLGMDDRGSLRVGMRADITAFRLVSGSFELMDCVQRKRHADVRIRPTLAFKDGRRVDCDEQRAQDERYWFMQVADDHLPTATTTLSAQQRSFVRALADALDAVPWELGDPRHISIPKALELRRVVEAVRRTHELDLTTALNTIYDCFLDNRFPMQIGLLLLRLERPFVLARLREIGGQPQHRAAA